MFHPRRSVTTAHVHNYRGQPPRTLWTRTAANYTDAEACKPKPLLWKGRQTIFFARTTATASLTTQHTQIHHSDRTTIDRTHKNETSASTKTNGQIYKSGTLSRLATQRVTRRGPALQQRHFNLLRITKDRRHPPFYTNQREPRLTPSVGRNNKLARR